ncbi:MAG: tRNA 2-thiouridine(34) synthase MnmA [Clostridia bacterium]|nr:tRNA 2-thiouridine(34) synthase MnmA [Clostridia bacterium]
MKPEKVAIGMSGGVDSSVAAALLKKSGYEVIGLTMILWDNDKNAIEDAKRVCEKMEIEHHCVDFRDEFNKIVIDYFVEEYQSGRTPNPCIVCNRFLKFDAMQSYAETLGADKIATGHYAKIQLDEESGRYLLKQANSCEKDQTYVLYSLTQKQLSRTLMPLGELKSKAETREIAEQLGFDVATKADSMEICFIPDQDYVKFIERYSGKKCTPGDFVDANGNVLGKHSGIINYTIGQRKGLGVTFGKPMFVTRIDAEKNTVVLGEKGTEFSQELMANKLNFIPFEKLTQPIQVVAKVRYSAKPAPATVIPEGEDMVRVVFDLPQRAVTPGQAVVFYDKNDMSVIGGGIIR